MKTTIDIEDDVYSILKVSEIATAITGKIFKGIERDDDSKKEDITIKVLANQNGELQEAFVNVNLYIQDAQKGKSFIENKPRMRTLIPILYRGLHCAGAGRDFSLYVEDQNTFKVDGSKVPEHFVNIKIKYKTYNP